MKRIGRFNVRVVKLGDKYGLKDRLTHDKAQPFKHLVEFYDATHADPETGRGQFVSRYYFDTLRRDSDKLCLFGLCLDGGRRDVWTLTPKEFTAAMAYAEGEL